MKSIAKSIFSKICCLFSAALLIYSLVPVQAFANPTSGTDVADSKVTINGLESGDVVSAYLIADADIDAANNLTYKMADGLPSAYNTIDKIAAVATDGYTFTQGTDMQNAAAAIAGAVTANPAAATATAGSDGSAKLTLGSGYYLVRVTTASGKTRVYQNMVVDVTPKVDGGTYKSRDVAPIDVKKTDVTVKKTVGSEYKESTDKYSVGDSVPFKINTAVPNYPKDSKNATFTIGDTPSAGLKIKTDTIKINGQKAVSGADYTLTASETGYTIEYSKDYVLAHPGEAIEVTYEAELTSDAFSHSATDVTGNTATVTFNPNPYENNTVTPNSNTTVKTYGYVFKKTDPEGNPLQGATFTLTLDNGKVLTSTSDANGYVYFSGLAAGHYKISETGVPTGYTKVNDIEFDLSDTTATADNPATTDVENNYLVNSQNVVDNRQPVLPVTGDAGTFMFTAIGTVLLVAGVGAIVYSRKQRA
ncbi:isopeptide-forming domain-containing fimbrial protein [Lancefieldella parvula]|uniref:isopeptide-forming domain-containing fimbrial protein n=1 Tax=Lancefieldella parvula TaxID=1382 RepID=UPI00290F7B07|nr:isopeptide-forming domain-containing fimbrial protein [Lancefieldella parvula]MDU4868131.1 isopeptide-forming domain-containing fimbrial protein [Lancefieldella parvula]